MNRLKLAAASIAISTSIALAAPTDWPQWRGPNLSGIVTEPVAKQWPEEGPKKLWSVPLDTGYASPIAHAGKLYLFYLDEQNQQEVLACLDANTGQPLWKQAHGEVFTGQYKGTRASPVIDADRIYTYGSNGQLTCRNLADGQQKWMTNVLKETGGKNKMWGLASNPLIDGDHIYVQAGEGASAAVAVNKTTGQIVWKSQAKDGGYAPPVLVELSRERSERADAAPNKHLVIFAHEHLVGINPKDGKTLWELNEPWEIEYNINATPPIVQGNKIFVTVAYKAGRCAQYEITPAGPQKKWEGKQVTGRFQPGILDNGHLYVNSEGLLKCLDWNTGKVLWSTKNSEKPMLGFGGTIVRVNNDQLICLSDRGKLTLLKATPQGYSKISELKDAVEGKEVWSTPLIYNGKLYLKGATDLACFDVAPK
jgi:outer membrane protein assembly factor BamB